MNTTTYTWRHAVAAWSVIAYLACIVGANAAIQHYGIISVGFGLSAPAGVYFIGPALAFRDLVQWTLGKYISLVTLTFGAVMSYAIADAHIATASAVAFGISELADFALFTWIAPRCRTVDVLGGDVSDAAGVVFTGTPSVLDWVIVGGESGRKARAMDTAWVAAVVDQCATAHAQVFVKQLGSAWAQTQGAAHPKGGDWDEWPEALRVRRFPLHETWLAVA